MVIVTKKCCLSPFIYFYFLSHVQFSKNEGPSLTRKHFFAQTLFLLILFWKQNLRHGKQECF